MKRLILNYLCFILGIVLVFVSATFVYAAYPGECTYKKKVCAGGFTSIVLSSPNTCWLGFTENPSTGQLTSAGSESCPAGTTVYHAYSPGCSYTNYYWENNNWIQAGVYGLTGGWFKTNPYDVWLGASSEPPPVEGCAPPPEPCPESGTQAGMYDTVGKYSNNGTLCDTGCVLVPSSTGVPVRLGISWKDDQGQWWTTAPWQYNGVACTGEEGPALPPQNCDEFQRQCEQLCRGGEMQFSCDEQNGHSCSCETPPPDIPWADQPPEGVGPDQDGDGVPSNGGDDDNDGDGIPNGDDPDIDGDGTDNGDDPDADGDGTGNGGNEESWDPPAGSPGGTGADPDVDGDGLNNEDDPDIDGDGIDNGDDPDADGDGLPNGEDLNPFGSPTGTGGGTGTGTGTGEGDFGTEGDGGGTGTGEDTDEDGKEDGYTGSGNSTIDFGPLLAAGDNMKKKFPASLVIQLKDVIQDFTAQGNAPVFSFTLPLAGDVNIDLSMFDPVASFIRGLFSLLIFAGGVTFIIKTWSN